MVLKPLSTKYYNFGSVRELHCILVLHRSGLLMALYKQQKERNQCKAAERTEFNQTNTLGTKDILVSKFDARLAHSAHGNGSRSLSTPPSRCWC